MHAGPLLRLCPSRYSRVPPLRGAFPPPASTETNIYGVTNIQRESPGAQVSPPVPEISHFGSLNRTSHLCPRCNRKPSGQRGLAPECLRQDTGHISSRKCPQLKGSMEFRPRACQWLFPTADACRRALGGLGSALGTRQYAGQQHGACAGGWLTTLGQFPLGSLRARPSAGFYTPLSRVDANSSEPSGSAAGQPLPSMLLISSVCIVPRI